MAQLIEDINKETEFTKRETSENSVLKNIIIKNSLELNSKCKLAGE